MICVVYLKNCLNLIMRVRLAAESSHCCSNAELIFSKAVLAWEATGKNLKNLEKPPCSSSKGNGPETAASIWSWAWAGAERVLGCSHTDGEFLLKSFPWMLLRFISASSLQPPAGPCPQSGTQRPLSGQHRSAVEINEINAVELPREQPSPRAEPRWAMVGAQHHAGLSTPCVSTFWWWWHWTWNVSLRQSKCSGWADPGLWAVVICCPMLPRGVSVTGSLPCHRLRTDLGWSPADAAQLVSCGSRWLHCTLHTLHLLKPLAAWRETGTAVDLSPGVLYWWRVEFLLAPQHGSVWVKVSICWVSIACVPMRFPLRSRWAHSSTADLCLCGTATNPAVESWRTRHFTFVYEKRVLHRFVIPLTDRNSN